MLKRDEALAHTLRSWRERLEPAELGLPVGAKRRVRGLRREEVAQLAGVSLDYLARLEQGRAGNPSQLVLAALARALRLTDDERAHLHRLAGYREPTSGTINRHIGPSVQRLLDRVGELPVLVLDAAWQVIAINPLADALLGGLSRASGRERNLAWRHFTGAQGPLVRDETDRAAAGAQIVADLRDALGRYPVDEQLLGLIKELRATSSRFAALWEQHEVKHRSAARKTFLHPEIGLIMLDCDVLVAQASDQRIVVYSAPAGSDDAQALALLGAIGTQSFS